ncbi:MAG: DegT/DnrJ/EryC1/StrS family aminotransferase [Planctomycetota bacterium]|nr:DegT/DnrJ/EryC1/StrS family aminotransferase [Planctomycetota bacterium]
MRALALHGGPKARTRPWPAAGPRFGREELKHLREALAQNTLFYTQGRKTRQLCARMARLCGVPCVVPCSSGSAAIHAAVKACGVGPGDEVITSPITDAGTILGVVYEGAIPVFADIDPAAYNITAGSIAQRITPRTRAVIVVHLAGCPADMEPIVALCRRRKLKLIEDCAQAWGARLNGRWVGSFGTFGCFSLNDFKQISCGDGGLVVTRDKALYRHAWLAADKCYDRLGGTRAMEFVAPNYRITELQSAVALAQLGKLPRIARRRHELGERLAAGLRRIPGVIPHHVPRGGYATYWFYLIQLVPAVLGVDVVTFAQAVQAEGIPVRKGYVDPVYLAYPYLQRRSAFNHSDWPFGAAHVVPPYRKGYCPNAETVIANCLFFPLNEWLSAREVDDTLAAIRKVSEHYRSRRPSGSDARKRCSC